MNARLSNPYSSILSGGIEKSFTRKKYLQIVKDQQRHLTLFLSLSLSISISLFLTLSFAHFFCISQAVLLKIISKKKMY